MPCRMHAPGGYRPGSRHTLRFIVGIRSSHPFHPTAPPYDSSPVAGDRFNRREQRRQTRQPRSRQR
jgi:hypothetical protein